MLKSNKIFFFGIVAVSFFVSVVGTGNFASAKTITLTNGSSDIL